MRQTRFQQGSLQIVKRAGGRGAWEYRWYELQADGSRTRRNLMVGSLEQYPNETAAQKAVAALRADINAENPRTSLTPISVHTLIEHYREKELGPDCTKSRKTQVTYAGYFRKWILPRWGSYRVTEVKAVAVEQWLRSLKYADGSKAKARNIMSAVFNHAVRWEWLDVNSIRMVRQSAKRTRIPIVLSIEQIAALLRILKGPTRTMVFLAVFTGLRVGELLGLKWKDIDSQKMEIHVIRSIVIQHVGDCETEASRKPVPLDLRLANVLWSWRLQSPYPTDEDWMFASPHSGGKQKRFSRPPPRARSERVFTEASASDASAAFASADMEGTAVGEGAGLAEVAGVPGSDGEVSADAKAGPDFSNVAARAGQVCSLGRAALGKNGGSHFVWATTRGRN